MTVGPRQALDVYSHILPAPYFEHLREVVTEPARLRRWLELPMLHDLSMRRELMSRHPGYQQVLTLSSPPIEQLGDADLGSRLARLANANMARIAADDPGRFPAWVAALPLRSIDRTLAELDLAIEEGARGIQLFTNVAGTALDEAGLDPVFERVEDLGLPIWLHPARGPAFADYVDESTSRYEIWWAFGWPYETSAACARLVFSGVFERYPDLRVITHHLGGMIPYFEGRIRHGWDQMGSRTADDDAEMVRTALDGPAVGSFRRLYGDTAISGSDIALRCGLDFFGHEHVLFGTDFPFDRESGAIFVRETLEAIDRLEVDDAVREAILSGNARRLLGLDARGADAPRTG